VDAIRAAWTEIAPAINARDAMRCDDGFGRHPATQQNPLRRRARVSFRS